MGMGNARSTFKCRKRLAKHFNIFAAPIGYLYEKIIIRFIANIFVWTMVEKRERPDSPGKYLLKVDNNYENKIGRPSEIVIECRDNKMRRPYYIVSDGGTEFYVNEDSEYIARVAFVKRHYSVSTKWLIKYPYNRYITCMSMLCIALCILAGGYWVYGDTMQLRLEPCWKYIEKTVIGLMRHA